MDERSEFYFILSSDLNCETGEILATATRFKITGFKSSRTVHPEFHSLSSTQPHYSWDDDCVIAKIDGSISISPDARSKVLFSSIRDIQHYMGLPFFYAGFPMTLHRTNPFTITGGHLKCLTGRKLMHDVFATQGMSGGALFHVHSNGYVNIVGVCSKFNGQDEQACAM